MFTKGTENIKSKRDSKFLASTKQCIMFYIRAYLCIISMTFAKENKSFSHQSNPYQKKKIDEAKTRVLTLLTLKSQFIT